MEGFPDIINTDIIPASLNTTWDENNLANGLRPKLVLIITTTYSDNTPEALQLQKIIAACKLTQEQYNIIQLNDNQLIKISHLLSNLNPKIVILFGILPIQLSISAQFILNEPNRFADCIFIPTLSLSDMEQLEEMKKQLWNKALKPVFVENVFGLI